MQELTAFFKASNISTRGKSGPSLSRSLVVSHGCFLPMGLGHPLLLGSNCRISVARIPYGANEGLSGEGKASRRALSGSLAPPWFRLAWAWCRDASLQIWISVARIPYGANEGLSGEGKASRRALSGSLEPPWFRLAWAWCRDASHLFPPVSALLQPGVGMEICPKMRPFLWL